MAVIENRFVCDLSKPVQAQALKGNVFSLDNLGSRLSVLIYNNGQPATISGSVTANCILPDGSTVNVNGSLTTENGGSKAYVDVPQSCLLIPGILKIAVKCTSSSVITTLAAIVANVYMTKTDNVITPSQQIITDWNAEISAAIATQNAAIANQDTKINDLKSALHIEKEKDANEFVTGKNLFNKATATDGAYKVYNSGNIISAQTMFYSDYIPVEPNTAYIIHTVSTSNLHICYYDFAQNFLSGELGYTFTTPQDCEYVVFSDLISNKEAEQFEKGSTPTTYESYRYELNELLVPEELKKEIDGKLNFEIGKNKFNKNTTNKLAGVYAAPSNGKLTAQSTYIALVMPLSEGNEISVNRTGTQVCFLSITPDLTEMSTGETLKGFISGVAATIASPIQGYTVPQGTVCAVISHPTNDLDNLQIEYGSESTPYAKYIEGLDSSKIIGGPKVYHVGKGYDFATIQAAVDAADDHSIILIANGTYDEAVDARQTEKFLTLQGESRDGVIITHDGYYYAYPPLEIGRGVVRDITFIRTGTTHADDGFSGAYCVHIDYDKLINQTLQFLNCRFINTSTPCVGVGLRENCRLSFVQCEFEADNIELFFCHEQQASNKEGQYVEFIDCSFNRLSAGWIIRLAESPEFENTSAVIRFQRNILRNGTDSDQIIHATQHGSYQPGLIYDGYLGTKLWTLDRMSMLNNESILNSK